MKKKNKKANPRLDYHGTTPEQVKQIDKILNNTWEDILDNVLTKEDKDENEMVLPGVLLSVEEQINRFASNFGLAALSEEQYEM